VANPTVDALNDLSIFGPRQAGAYREHAGAIKEALGPDIETQARSYVQTWAKANVPGVLILTGNAGTGKTALVECYCEEAGAEAPATDELFEALSGRFVVKDLSGVTEAERRKIFQKLVAIRDGEKAQLFLCANEGVLRDTAEGADDEVFQDQLNRALEAGAHLSGESNGVSVINMNRQRWTSAELWDRLLDYLVRDDIWTACEGCQDQAGCPISANAAALRREIPREAMRRLIQLGSGTAVGTLRELLSIISYAVTGGIDCQEVAERSTARPFTADSAYFNLAVGSGLDRERIERSTLLQAVRTAGLGLTADVQIDGWLRDPAPATTEIRQLAEPPTPDPHALVETSLGAMTFGQLGETVSVSDDDARVEACLKDFAKGRNALALWRRRVFFEAQPQIGGPRRAFRRLTRWTTFGDLLTLAEALSNAGEPADERQLLITGLNYLSAGFHSYDGSLVVPEAGSLAARNPGAFYPPSPSLVHTQVRVESVSLALEDGEELKGALDTDNVRVVVTADLGSSQQARLLVTPPLYEAVVEAARFRSPVGSDIPEMSELRAFYGDLSSSEVEGGLRIVDPEQKVIRPVTLPTLPK
jgi:hypothetical protein